MPDKIKRYVVKVSESAKSDLREITKYISQDSPQTSIKILDKIEAKISTLDHFPDRGSYVPELLERNVKDYRQITEAPWKIIYKINDQIVNVLAVIDSRRNLQDVLIRKFLK